MYKYWIKLYHEILDDPKMGRLSDRTWRRTNERQRPAERDLIEHLPFQPGDWGIT